MSSERRYLFLLASARQGGNSETLARHGAASLKSDVAQRWLRFDEYSLPPFEDLRAVRSMYPAPEGTARTLLEATLWATDLVLVTPLYWYALPAPAKLYLDYLSAWLRVPELDFRAHMADKTLRAVVVSSGDAAEAEPLSGSLRLTAAYLNMRWPGLLLGHGNRPGDVLEDRQALETVGPYLRATS